MKPEGIKLTGINYIWILYILMFAALTMVMNNYLIYNSLSNRSDRNGQVSDNVRMVFDRVSMISEENQNLRTENQLLKSKVSEFEAKTVEQSQQLESLHSENTKIKQQINELTKDNISLENTLKTAASVGIKPQNYREFTGISASRSSIERGKYIGKFRGTVYTPSTDECGNDKGITFSGEPIIPGISVAVDLNYWPLGTVFYIRGLGYVVAMDKGSAIKGKYRFDFAVFDKKFANAIGSQMWDVYIIKMGNGKVENIEL